MSFIEQVGTGASGLLTPIIQRYQKPGFFRDAVKTILTGNPDQICPCGVLHGSGKNCSSVILKIAKHKPGKLPLALAVQRQRCRDAAAQILAEPTLLQVYQDIKEEERRKSRRKTQTCDGTSGMYCFDIGNCIPFGRSKTFCDGPDCTPGKCDIDCTPGGCDGCS